MTDEVDLAAKDEGGGARAPAITMVRDVLVVPSPGHRANPDEWMKYRALDGPVDLGNGVMLERLWADDLAEEVIPRLSRAGSDMNRSVSDGYRPMNERESIKVMTAF